MTTRAANHLCQETSPYLLQHAFNPVDWYPWNDEALSKAKEENKLLIISIGYAACHWCHVMEHESFNDEEVAALMNRLFISVKVDREERPDVDHLYMSSCQLLGSRGGWPLNIIALADQRPVFAGTYFSKRDWIYILNYLSAIHAAQPQELIDQAQIVSEGFRKIHCPPTTGQNSPKDKYLPELIFSIWEEELDFNQGGTLGAPKFPMPANLSAILAFGQQGHNQKAVQYVLNTLDKMAMGGIYDHIGGGFSRYSVDGQWKVPHFEKMLYDNAQLVSLYSQGFLLTKQDSLKIVIQETLDFIDRELTHPEGIFYASLDADSQGNEGDFYTWTSGQIRKILSLSYDPELFLEYFSCLEEGNWEHGLNILRKTSDPSVLLEKYGISEKELSDYIKTCQSILLKARNSRVHPGTDDKILTGWNGLMINGLLEASRALHSTEILGKAIKAGTFYLEHVLNHDGNIYRNYKNGKFSIPAFLDDYAFLISAFLELYQQTFELSWIEAADRLTRQVLTKFCSEEGIYFYLSSGRDSLLIQKTMELIDHVIPSSNSRMAENLLLLGYLNNKQSYITHSEKMLSGMLPTMRQNPGFHSRWFALLNQMANGPLEIRISGFHRMQVLEELRQVYLSQAIYCGNTDVKAMKMPEDLNKMEKTKIYICHNQTCFPPVSNVPEALELIFQKWPLTNE